MSRVHVLYAWLWGLMFVLKNILNEKKSSRSCFIFVKACPHWRQKSPKTETKSIRSSSPKTATKVAENGDNKKLSYRRETGIVIWYSYMKILKCTEHRRIAEVVLFLTFKRSDSRSAGQKRILSWNSHPRSFKVIHFAFICRSTRGSISSYNIACRILSLIHIWRCRRRG